MHRTPLIAANWKMHTAPNGFDAPASPYRPRDGVDVVVLPSFLDIRHCLDVQLLVGAQCGRPETDGAFTGDVSMRMIRDAGCQYVLCGHSERRRHYAESDADVAGQAQAAVAAGLTPIVCIGETLDERKAGQEKAVVQRQIAALPEGITVIAYEPVWAIGTGKNATPSQVQEMHAFLRSLLRQGETVRLLYGGSVTAENARDILAQADVDGALVGGASLTPETFAAIVAAAVAAA